MIEATVTAQADKPIEFPCLMKGKPHFKRLYCAISIRKGTIYPSGRIKAAGGPEKPMKPHDNFKAILTLSICAAQVRTQCEYLRSNPKIKPHYKALLLVVEKAVTRLEKYHKQTVEEYDEMEELGAQLGEQIENAVTELIKENANK